MTLMKDDSGKNRTVILSLENEALNNLFMSDYYDELKKLSDLEREILLRCYDNNGMRSMSANEIGSELGISPAKVYREKSKALKKLQSSKKMRGYYEK